MTNAEGNSVPSYYVVITIDIDDCPMAEIPLTKIFDLGASLLLNDYHNFVRVAIVQELEDTTLVDGCNHPRPP
jgi:hypothetical protein